MTLRARREEGRERQAGGKEEQLVEQKTKVFLRSEEHTSELQSRQYLVCRLLLEKKKSMYLAGARLPPLVHRHPLWYSGDFGSDYMCGSFDCTHNCVLCLSRLALMSTRFLSRAVE